MSEFEILSGDRIIGEVENVAPGLNKEFSLTLKPGTYTTYVPGRLGPLLRQARGHRDRGHQAVGRRARPRSTSTASTWRRRPRELVTATKAFTDAVDRGNLEQAKALYAPSRVAYERIEPVAETFGDLDPEIDAREGDVPEEGVGRVPLPRAEALGRRHHRRAHRRTPRTLNDDVATLQNLVKDVELQPACDRQRRGRAAQRGVDVEDHG